MTVQVQNEKPMLQCPRLDDDTINSRGHDKRGKQPLAFFFSFLTFSFTGIEGCAGCSASNSSIAIVDVSSQ